MKSIRKNLAALSLGTVLLAGAAHAQAPGATTDPAAAGGATVTNTTETVTTTSPDSIAVDTGEAVGGTALPNTGGAPLVMVLAGCVIAGGSLLLRRKLA